MRTSSAKAKGRRGCAAIRALILERFKHLTENDISIAPSGVNGQDLWLSEIARRSFPFAVESKVQEKLNIWAAIEQAEKNAGGLTPLVYFRRNRSDGYICIKAEHFMGLLDGNGD